MAYRVEIVDEEYIGELKDKSQTKTVRTRGKVRSSGRKFFKKWANERNFQANLEEY